MKTRLNDMFLVLVSSVFLVAFSGTGCGGGDGSDTGGNDVVEDTPTNVDSGPPPIPDVPAETTPDDGPPDNGPVKACDPPCDYTAFQYCDETEATCKELLCDFCYKDMNCADGEFCLDYVFEDFSHSSVCSNDCLDDGDCNDGFACDMGDGKCIPLALCKPKACGNGELGDPCEYQGVNEGCTECGEGLKCGGRAPISDTPCMWDADCIAYGIPWQQNPQCVSGLCGYSYCTQPCDEGKCPEGFAAISTLFACNCIPVGTAGAGEACPIFNVHLEAEACGAYLTCIGIESTQENDPCTIDADCPDEGYIANGQCVDEFCGSSFCCPYCDENDECEDDFGPIDVSGTCFCAPMETGDAQAGDPCPIFNVNADADLCAGGLTCIGIEATEESDDCTTDAECPDSDYFANGDCVEGFCGSSFCSPKCDINGDCDPGFGPIDVSGKCYCAPVEVGDSAEGDPCPIFGVNEDADACQAGLVCLGMPADEDSLICLADADCSPVWHPGSPECIDGRCGTSFCSPKCDQEGECAEGFKPIDVSDKCYCAPEVTGDALAGDPCPMGNVNTDAEVCGGDLACLGLAAFDWSASCESAGDCLPFGGMTNDCLIEYCGMSMCAAECDEDGLCAEGALPYLVDGDTCYCLTGLDVGHSPAGGACPFVNVNLDAETCNEGLTCVGLLAGPKDGVECETAEECPAADNPGVADCVNGNCGSSFCAPKCDAEGKCEEGFEPFQLEDESCYCGTVPPG